MTGTKIQLLIIVLVCNIQVEVDNQRRPVKIGERFFPSAKL